MMMRSMPRNVDDDELPNYSYPVQVNKTRKGDT